MPADVTKRRRPQQRIAQSVDNDVAVGVRKTFPCHGEY